MHMMSCVNVVGRMTSCILIRHCPSHSFLFPLPNNAKQCQNADKGKVSDYNRGTYTITYSDGDKKKYSDMNDMIEMVNQAADLVLSGGYKTEGEHPNPYPVGTRVYYHFPQGWYNGYIANFDKGTYRITWSDFSIGEPDKGLKMVKQMVAQAAQQAMGFKPDVVEKYDIGTPVYYKFKR